MNKLIKITFATLLALLSTISMIPAQKKMDHCKMDKCTNMSCCSMDKTVDVSMNMNNPLDNQSIDIKTIDKNKDGKVFQCPMCADQISDEVGKCSKCGMNLKEVSIEDAQKSLDDSGNQMMGHSKMEGHKMDHSNMMNHDMHQKEHTNMQMNKETIIREGEIDIIAIDKNGDKKVFQDPMDWNVISDEAGKCPLCEMKLIEVSLEEAKENLLKHNFKVKN